MLLRRLPATVRRLCAPPIPPRFAGYAASYNHKGDTDRQWLYIPLLNAPAASRLVNVLRSLAGTDFTYEDVEERVLDDSLTGFLATTRLSTGTKLTKWKRSRWMRAGHNIGMFTTGSARCSDHPACRNVRPGRKTGPRASPPRRSRKFPASGPRGMSRCSP